MWMAILQLLVRGIARMEKAFNGDIFPESGMGEITSAYPAGAFCRVPFADSSEELDLARKEGPSISTAWVVFRGVMGECWPGFPRLDGLLNVKKVKSLLMAV